MPTLIRLEGGAFREVVDPWRDLADDAALPPEGPLIVSATRLAGGEPFGDRQLGVRLTVGDPVEAVAPGLHRLSLVALDWPKFRDGRPLSTARLLRERWGFRGEVRAVGDCRRDQAFHMVRCGYDAFAPADDSSADDWAASAGAFRFVYTRAADGRPPAYALRGA